MIRVKQIKVPIRSNQEIEIKKRIGKKLRIKEEEIESILIKKKSIDARDKNQIYYIYECDCSVLKEENILRHNKSNDVSMSLPEEYKIEVTGKLSLKHRPIIVGSGPAGLFCSYLLAELGYRPILLERGEQIEERI